MLCWKGVVIIQKPPKSSKSGEVYLCYPLLSILPKLLYIADVNATCLRGFMK